MRLAIGGVAVLGIGAAITTAAWTDQVWFTAQASAADVGLYGALAVDGTCPAPGAAYQEADTSADGVSIGLTPFENLVPGDARSVGICLWNGSDVDLSVSLAPIDIAGDPVFGAGGATIGVEDGGSAYATQRIVADAVKPLEVVVETPNTWNESFQGAESGTIAVTFTGSTDL